MRIKKLLSVLLILAMMLAWMPMPARAEEGVIASGTCGQNLTWVLTEDGTMTISGTGDMDDYFYDDLPPWGEHRESICKIVIEPGVANIGEFSFYRCTNLSSVDIPDALTYIPMAAFCGCTHLSDITIPKSVTYIGIDAFSQCTSLSEIVIPASVTMIENNPFDGATSLQRITVDSANKVYKDIDGVLFHKNGDNILVFPGGKGGSYTIPEGVRGAYPSAFSRCGNITDITIPASFEEMQGNLFAECSSLNAINVNPGNKYYYSDEGVMFSHDNMLVAFPAGRSGSYTVPNGITVIGKSSFSQSQLTSVVISEGVTDIKDYAFSYCSNLETVTISETVRRIETRAFGSCGKLTNVVFLGDAPSMCGWEEGSFYNITATVYYPENNETWVDKINCDYGGTLTWVPVSPYKQISCGFNEHILVHNGESASYSFTPEESGLYIFYASYPEAPQDLFIPSPRLYIYDNGVSVEEDSWYYGIYAGRYNGVVCEMEAGKTYILEVVDYDYDDADIEIDVFLDIVSMPESICMSGSTQMLKGSTCEFSLEITAGFPFFNGETVWTVSDNSILKLEYDSSFYAGFVAMNYGTATITATLENGVSASFEVTVLDSIGGFCGDQVTWGMDEAGTLTISGVGSTWDYANDASGEWWGDYPEVPWDRSMVKTVIVEPGVTTIGNALFNNCRYLTSVTLPEGLTSIGGRAFFCCSELPTITIPKNVTHIGVVAFFACSKLSTVYFLGDAPTFNSESHVFGSDYIQMTLHYPYGNETWTNETMGNLGYNVNWVAYDPCELGHTYESAITAPTCTEQGYTTHTCTVCGDSYVDDFTEKYDHFFENGRCSHCGTFESVYTWGQGDTYPIEIRVYGETSIEAVYVDGEAVEFQCSFNEEWYFLTVSIDMEYLNALPLGEYEIKILLPDGTEYYAGLEVCESEWIELEPNCSYTVTDWGTYRYTCPQDGIAGFSIDAGADWFYSVYTLDTAGDYHIIIDSSVEPVTAAEFDVAAGEQIWIAVVPAGETVMGTADFSFTFEPKADEHVHNYASVVTAPTCTEQGYTTHTCTVCGDSYTDSYVDAIGHNYESVVTAPTYEEQGYTTYTCTNCGHSYTADYVDPLIRYEVLDGNGIEWSGESEAPVAIRVDVEITLFVEVWLNGELLDPANYTVTEGSTIVTLKSEYLVTLPSGEYTMEIVFTDGIAEATFHVTDSAVLGDVDGNGEIDTTDAYLIVMYYNEKMDLAEDQLLAADVDGNGEVDTTDAYYIVMYYNEKIDSFPSIQ